MLAKLIDYFSEREQNPLSVGKRPDYCFWCEAFRLQLCVGISDYLKCGMGVKMYVCQFLAFLIVYTGKS